MMPSYGNNTDNSLNNNTVLQDRSNLIQTDDKSSSLNPTTKTKSFSELKIRKNVKKQKILLPKNHRKIYENFKSMLLDYDKEDAFSILESVLEEVNMAEDMDDDF